MRNTEQESKVDGAPNAHGCHYIDVLSGAWERVMETRRKFNDVIENTGDRMCAFAIAGVAVSHRLMRYQMLTVELFFRFLFGSYVNSAVISVTVDSTAMNKRHTAGDSTLHPLSMTQIERDADGVQWNHFVVVKKENTFSIPCRMRLRTYFPN